jgi:alpha-galactosidase
MSIRRRIFLKESQKVDVLNASCQIFRNLKIKRSHLRLENDGRSQFQIRRGTVHRFGDRDFWLLDCKRQIVER